MIAIVAAAAATRRDHQPQRSLQNSHQQFVDGNRLV